MAVTTGQKFDIELLLEKKNVFLETTHRLYMNDH
jgi:hypothetical protein